MRRGFGVVGVLKRRFRMWDWRIGENDVSFGVWIASETGCDGTEWLRRVRTKASVIEVSAIFLASDP